MLINSNHDYNNKVSEREKCNHIACFIDSFQLCLHTKFLANLNTNRTKFFWRIFLPYLFDSSLLCSLCSLLNGTLFAFSFDWCVSRQWAAVWIFWAFLMLGLPPLWAWVCVIVYIQIDRFLFIVRQPLIGENLVNRGPLLWVCFKHKSN